MKLGFFGNMNNNFFSLVRYLRDRGHDAELLYPVDADHFLPSADTYTLEYQTYAQALDWTQQTFYTLSEREIKRVAGKYEFIAACGYPAAVLAQADIRPDMYVPYGSDVYKYAHLRQHFSLRHRFVNAVRRLCRSKSYKPWDMRKGTSEKYLRKGIRTARHILCYESNSEFENKLAALGLEGRRHRFPIPFFYAPQYEPEELQNYYNKTHWSEEFRQIRNNYDLVIFHHCRHTWKTHANDFTYKGNDRLFRAVAAFAKQRKDLKVCLVTMEYGHDYPASRQLVKELDMERFVRWFPRMYRKDLMVGLHLADICTGEFEKSWFLYGAIMEGMAMGKPILHYRESKCYEGSYSELYPMMNARTTDEIVAALTDYVSRPAYWKQKGQEGRQWFQKYVINQPLEKIEEIIKSEK